MMCWLMLRQTVLNRPSLARFSTSARTSKGLDVAVVGSGLTGLSSAYHLVESLSETERENIKITVYEATNRIGGWCKSEKRNIEHDGKDLGFVIFEDGPRSIRPAGYAGWETIALTHKLGLEKDLISVPKTASSAKNRFILLPKTKTPTQIPTSLVQVLKTKPVRKLIPHIVKEPLGRHKTERTDESVDWFFTRHFGKTLSGDFVSAMIHGIYGADSRQISMKATFPGLLNMENQTGSLVLYPIVKTFKKLLGLWKESEHEKLAMEEVRKEKEIKRSLPNPVVERLQASSVWGLKGGLGGLTTALENHLREKGVKFQTKMKLHNVTVDADGITAHDTESSKKLQFNYYLTTTPKSLPKRFRVPDIPASTLGVVSLTFCIPKDIQNPLPAGFGYLIPRTTSWSFNPYGAIGIVFDSDVMPEVDPSTTLTDHRIIKLTFMLGGPHWSDDSAFIPLSGPTSSPEELKEAALETLQLHYPGASEVLGEPIAWKSSVKHNCIPIVPVGYWTNWRTLHHKMIDTYEDGGKRVLLAGGGSSPVGVNGAIVAGKVAGEEMAYRIKHDLGLLEARQPTTGLERWL